APTLEAEDAAPDAVKMHGNDRRVYVLHDALHATAEGEHLADAGDLPFGEDADDLPLLNGLAGSAQRADHIARAELRRNRNRFAQPSQGLRSEEHTSELQSLAYLVCRL